MSRIPLAQESYEHFGLSRLFSPGFCFLTFLFVLAAVLTGLLWPAPHQPLIHAIQAKENKTVHRLLNEALMQIERDMEADPHKWKGRRKAEVEDVEFGSGRRAMHIAGMHGDSAIVKYLHKRGAGLHHRKEHDHRTPLHLAATFNTREVVETMLDLGAEIDARAEYGWTPLLKAVLLSNHDIVSLLLSRGADPHARVDGSFSVMQCALIYSDSRMALILMQTGAEVEPGEAYYEDFHAYRQNFIKAGVLKVEEIPKRKLGQLPPTATLAG